MVEKELLALAHGYGSLLESRVVRFIFRKLWGQIPGFIRDTVICRRIVSLCAASLQYCHFNLKLPGPLTLLSLSLSLFPLILKLQLQRPYLQLLQTHFSLYTALTLLP